MYVVLEKIYKEKINSTIIYMNGSITVQNFSSGVWNAPDSTIKILVSTDDLVKMKISVYPNGSHKLFENYVSIYASLLSRKQHCQVLTIQFSILTPKRIQTNKNRIYCYWPEYEISCGLNEFVSHDTCRNVSEGILNDDILTILIEIFCTSIFERQSESLINSSPVHSVEMWYDWTVCNLSTFPEVPDIKIYSGQFPSNSDELVQFHLQLGPRGIQTSQKGKISLFLCIHDRNKAGLSLSVTYTFTIRNYGAEGEVFYVKLFVTVFNASESTYWGNYDFLLYEKAIKKLCLTIELRSIYSFF